MSSRDEFDILAVTGLARWLPDCLDEVLLLASNQSNQNGLAGSFLEPSFIVSNAKEDSTCTIATKTAT